MLWSNVDVYTCKVISILIIIGHKSIVYPIKQEDNPKFEFMPMFMVKNIVIAFDPNSPHDNAPKEVLQCKPRFEFLLNATTKAAIFPIKFMKWVVSSPIKLKKNLKSPLPLAHCTWIQSQNTSLTVDNMKFTFCGHSLVGYRKILFWW